MSIFQLILGRNWANGRPSSMLVNYHVALSITLISIFFLGLHDLFSVRDINVQAKYWYFMTLFFSFPYLLARSKEFSKFLLTPFPKFVALFALLNLIHLTMLGSGSQLSQVVSRIELLLFSLPVIFVIVSAIQLYRFSNLFYWLIFVSVILVAYSFAFPGEMFPLDIPGATVGRGGGALINPNKAGEALVLLFILASASSGWLVKYWGFLLSGLGVLLTVSRSSIMVWIVCAIWIAVQHRFSMRALFISISALGLMVLGGYYYVNSIAELSVFDATANDILDRFQFFSSGYTGDSSAQDRQYLAIKGFEVFLDNLVWGIGAASTSVAGTRWSFAASVHNQWLLIGVEYGLIGLVMWAWLNIHIWRHQRHNLLVVTIILFYSMFTHNMLDNLYWFISLGVFSSINFERKVELKSKSIGDG